LPSRSAARALPEVRTPKLVPVREHRAESVGDDKAAQRLLLANGIGGFSADGTEYVVTTDAGRRTPAPWVNVLANPRLRHRRLRIGRRLHVERERARIPPDAVEQRPGERCGGEACYLRDEETGHVWSAAPLPARGRSPYVTRHGFGYTVFEHSEAGIATEMWVFVARDAPVKFSLLKIRNTSERARRISVTGYVEWVLGETRTRSAMHIVTEKDGKSGALLARNPFSIEFGGRVAFFDVDDATRTFTCDRTEFIGRGRTLAAPAAMERARLSGEPGPRSIPAPRFRSTSHSSPEAIAK
jgi:cellobiose phosphorylase